MYLNIFQNHLVEKEMRDKIPHSLCNQIYVFHPKILEQSSITGESWVQFLGQLLCYLPTSQQIYKPVEFQCRSSISYMQQTLSFLANNFKQFYSVPEQNPQTRRAQKTLPIQSFHTSQLPPVPQPTRHQNKQNKTKISIVCQ